MKTFIATLYAAILFCPCVFAQQDFRLLSGNQEIIQNAIDSAIVIVRQDYVLQSRNNPSLNFGRGDNRFFGRKYALAVLSGKKLLFDISLESPWLEDPTFAEYKDIDTLRPVLSETWVRPVYGNSYTKIIKDSLPDPLNNDSLYKMNGIGICPSPLPVAGLHVKILDTVRDGWLVLVSSELDLSLNDTIPVKMIIYREKPEYIRADRAGKIKPPSQPTKILGGIFVLPEYRMGTVQFYLSGIYIKKILNYYVTSIPEIQMPSQKPNSEIPLKPIRN